MDRRVFNPITVIPTFDYHANSRLDLTINPEVVGNPARSSISEEPLGIHITKIVASLPDLMALATFRLTSYKFDDLRQHFDVSGKVKSVDNIMTAILGCRLAFQMGSYVSLIQELVAAT